MTCAADNYRDRHEHFTRRSAAEREVLFYEASVGALENAATSGSLVVCDLVYAELCTYFSSQRECDAFLEGNEIRVEPLSREALFLASRTWRTYRKQGGQRTRILVDFLIGAHAQTQATRLVSRDRGAYRKLFPSWRGVRRCYTFQTLGEFWNIPAVHGRWRCLLVEARSQRRADPRRQTRGEHLCP